MDTLSYWTATSTRPGDWSQSPLSESVDVAIVGGGYTGLSAALHLRREGASVAVLERHHMGWGASGRNGGMVLPGLKHGVDVLMKRYGYEAAKRLFAMSLESIETVKRIIADEKIDCDWQEVGYFYAAWKPGHLKHIEADHRLMKDRFDYETRLIPAGRTAEEVGTARYYGGQVDECGGGLHPGKYVTGLAGAVNRAGAALCESTEVQRIIRGDQGFEVMTSRGVIRAKNVIIGTNGYTGSLTPWIRRRVFPLGSYIIVTEPLDQEVADRLIPHRRMIFDSKNMLYYFRILPDNRMMFGGRVSFVPATSERSGELLRRGMIELFPELASTRIEYSWGGMLGITFDLMPHAGWHEGILYSVGYCGHGVAMATYMGMKLADVLSGKAKEPPFADIKAPTNPFYWKNPWFLPLVGEYYRLIDRML